MAAKRIRVLLVDHELDQVERARVRLQDRIARTDLFHVRDGREAMAFLRHAGPFSNQPRPDLILLEVDMPRMDGRSLLAWLKSDPDLKRIPAIVLSAEAAPSVVRECYDLGANCYLPKPRTEEDISSLAELLEDFWLGAVELPSA